MRKQKLLLIIMVVFLPIVAMSQGVAGDTLNSLVISEWRGDASDQSYLELTNMGSEDIDLSKITISGMTPWSASIGSPYTGAAPSVDGIVNVKRLEGILEPGESYTIVNVNEMDADFEEHYQRNMTKPLLWELADLEVYRYESTAFSAQGLQDSISQFYYLIRNWNGAYAQIVYYNFDDGLRDSVMVDAVNLVLEEDGTLFGPTSEVHHVAGVWEATDDFILVRKNTVVNGNKGEWDASRGISTEDSEWILIPTQGSKPGGHPYFTPGNHGNSQLDYSSSIYSINETDMTLTVPWGTQKGDSIVIEDDALILGEGMAWEYVQNDIWEDSASSICNTGDTLRLFACGDVLSQADFRIIVAEPTDDIAEAFHKTHWNSYEGAGDYYMTYDNDETWTTDQDGPWRPYYVTKGFAVDTIGDVPFGERTDSLMAYVDIPPNATYEFIWVDGTERADLKMGDILKITAANGSVNKEYYIDVQEYEAGANPLLGAITWPDRPEFIEGWLTGDTIPDFDPTGTQYLLTLPYGTTQVPAIAAHSLDMNAKVTIERATTFNGSLDDRTSTITVMAEDDSTELTYMVIFEVEVRTEDLQPFRPDPIISQLGIRLAWGNGFIEVFNPGNKDLDLSGYMLHAVYGGYATPAEALLINMEADSLNGWHNRYKKYIPGMKYTTDEDWITNPGAMVIDPAVNPVIKPGGTFIIANFHNREDRTWTALAERADMQFSMNVPNIHEETFNWNAVPYLNGAHDLLLWKIKNDSILDGTKGTADANDFELIDAIGPSDATNWLLAGSWTMPNQTGGLIRNPDIWQGNPVTAASFGTSDEDCEWEYRKHAEAPPIPGNFLLKHWWVGEGMGSHVFSAPTGYMSRVTAILYKVSKGYEGIQSIEGDLVDLTVDGFTANLVKPDPEQDLVVISGDDGSVKASDAAIVAGDSLFVTSADGTNMTKYELLNEPMDDNALLVVKSGSEDAFAVTVDGDMGTITGTGVQWGIAIMDVLDAMEVPALATLDVIDQNDNLVPLTMLNAELEKTDVLLTDSVYFRVVAENSTTIVSYRLLPPSLASDAFVSSSLYLVAQDLLIISLIPQGTGVATFLANVTPVSGATITVVDKLGLPREAGIMATDDRLQVVSEDESKSVDYYLSFMGEMNPDVQNFAPEVDVTAPGSANVGVAITVSAEVSDDGEPQGSVLTYLWEVTAGNAGDVVIAAANELSSDVTFNEAGNFELSLTVSDGDKSTTIVLAVVVNTVGIDRFDISTISIYPNPANEVVNVRFGTSFNEESEIKIVDMVGKVAYVGRHFDNHIPIDLAELSAGVYFMLIKVDDQSLVRKFDILK